jgi:hypothetical protein
MHMEIMGEIQLSIAQVQSRRLLERDVIVADHRDIVDKIRSGDPEAASAAVLSHLNHACAALMRHFQPELSHAGLPAGPGQRPATRTPLRRQPGLTLHRAQAQRQDQANIGTGQRC